MKHYILTIALMAVSIASQAQKADKLYDNLSLQDAIDRYESILEEDSRNGKAMYELANAYRLNNETVKAEKWFSKAVETSEEPKAKFYYAQMLLMNSKPAKAKTWFNNYKLNVSGKEANHIDNFITLCYLAETDQLSDRNFEISRVIFNSEKLDFSPSYFGDDILFVSNREESEGAKNKLDDWTDEKYTDLFIASPKNGFKVTSFSSKVNSSLHESSGVFNSDLSTLFFTRSNQSKGRLKDDKEKNIRLQIMETSLVENKWTKPSRLAFNNSNYSFCHPALSKDNNTIIFASDQPGGYGGMDLYIVKKIGDEWGVPENMGNRINTTGNEVFPFLDEKSNLYFSSNFHAGYGGLDIFKSEKVGNNWKKPRNLGLPLNSFKDDFGVITKDHFETGYFSSNRSGNDEIYTFENIGAYRVSGIVKNCETGKIIPNANVTISQGENILHTLKSDEKGEFSFETRKDIGILKANASKPLFETSPACTGENEFDVLQDNLIVALGLINQVKEDDLVICGEVLNESCNYLLEGAKITIINICNGEAVTVQSDRNGKFTYPLLENCKYKITAEKEYFETINQTFTTDSLKTKDCYELKFNMKSTVDLRDPALGYKGSSQVLLKEGTVIDLYNIYFDFDKSYIRNDATEELQWVKTIMKNYPTMKVEISAHTDARASNAYNNTLSQNRAESARNWLIANGVNANNIIAKGYGESKLKNECVDGVTCTRIKHQRNRRVEFKVLNFKGEAIVSKEWKAYKNSYEE